MKIVIFIFLTLSQLFLPACQSDKNLSCVYVPVVSEENNTPELTQFKNCAYISSDKSIAVFPEHINNINFIDNLASIRVDSAIYYINQLGITRRVHLFDNGADYFIEGLSRTIKNNQYGFINKKLDVVINENYDFAFPFTNGKAMVCIGCKSKLNG
ncbi:MAG: WG repeat-containing protein, partial [Gammaproteobacteria bacterium]|nr:WG repeat-containing protein [Gammaproteobacteria bacterium]